MAGRGSQKSVMVHDFSKAPQANIPRSSFDRSHGIKTTFDSGYLVPIFVDEALPGDTFNLRMTGFARMATPINPIMDNLYMETFFFSVPVRQVWDNFRKFCGEQVNPGDSTDFTVPTCSYSGGSAPAEQSLQDYMGLPLGKDILVNNLPFRAVNHIFNEWFRDQNLQNSKNVPTDDGPDTATDFALFRRCKKRDYFTSALPWPQKGDAVDLPLGSTAPITTTAAAATGSLIFEAPNEAAGFGVINTSGAIGLSQNASGPANLFADLSTATAATINQLREAFQVQRLLERDARGGTRYAEIVKAHFGVDFQDVRYRPEYLGGGSTPINISQVPQTSETVSGGNTPQGNLAAYATASLNGHGFTKSFTEHCYVIGFVNVRADLTYQQGVNKMWLRSTRYDFYWPALSHLGEQAILNREIFHADNPADSDTFGYQERYAEYRYKPSIITGKFRSTATASLDAWHLGQDYASLPALNDAWIQDDPPMDRVLAVPSEPDFLFDGYFNYKCARPMPLYAVPGMIDHF